VIANSSGTSRRCRALGARATRVVHLGTDVPAGPSRQPPFPTLVTVAHLAARKRHADVISALALLRGRHPGLRYEIVGDGPERERLAQLSESLLVDDLIEFHGQLDHDQAIAVARAATLFVLPSVDEAFGVAYIEAMAGAVPAIGCRGEDGPEEIAAAGGGIALVPPRDATALAAQIDALLLDPAGLQALGRKARETAEREFTWARCGAETVEAYQETLAAGRQRKI
jgi:glycosyltransferase involved in cell wall biosynthesis